MLLFSDTCFLGSTYWRRVVVALPAPALGIGFSQFRRRRSVVDLADTGHCVSALDNHHVRHRRAWRCAGLGLVVVTKLVEDNGVSIEIRTIQEKGTTFIIKLPVEKPVKQL